MAYKDRDDDRKPTFALGEFSAVGNMVDDPKEIGKGDNTVVAFKVAFNSRNYKEYEGNFFVGCTARGLTAERILADGHKGKRVIVKGDLYSDEPWENKDGDLVPAFSMNVREIGESWKFPEKNGSSSGGSRRSSRDEDDEPRGRSGRSSRGGDDDEPRGRSGRTSSRSSRDEDDEPRGRSRRSSREDADEPRGRTRRSRGEVEDNGDSVDD